LKTEPLFLKTANISAKCGGCFVEGLAGEAATACLHLSDSANWFLAHRAGAVGSLHPTTLDHLELLIDVVNKALA
jgi:hypothetical protein